MDHNKIMGPEKIRNDKADRKWQNNVYQKGICGRRVLIELYWNVNFIDSLITAIWFTVLIELYWNVNQKELCGNDARAIVLIELYWNVNIIRKNEPSATISY